MSKYVAKFRKNRDYDDDYSFYEEKKKKTDYSKYRKMKNYRYEDLDYYGDDYVNTKRKKEKSIY